VVLKLGLTDFEKDILKSKPVNYFSEINLLDFLRSHRKINRL